MSSHHFAAKPTAVHTTTVQALLARSTDRLPLEIALQLAHEVASAVSQAHEAGVVLGQLDAATLEIDAGGAVQVLSGHGAVLAPELAQGGTASIASDVYAVGAVLFEIFTGLTPAQAKARLAVTALHTMPSPSRFNPTLDDRLDELISSMLAKDPVARPATMLVVQARVLAAFDEVGLEPSAAALALFVTPGKRDRVPTQPFIPIVVPPPAPVVVSAPTVIVSAPAPVKKPAKAAVRRAPPRSWQTDEGEDEVEESLSTENVIAWRDAPKFDGWALGAICFSVLAIVLALVH